MMNIKISLVVLPLLVASLMECSEALFPSRSATCVIRGDPGVHGVIHLVQNGLLKINITGYVHGLTEGKHGFHVHEHGDLSNGCISTGGHYNPFGTDHGAPSDLIWKRHFGDLGNIVADKNGTAKVQIIDRLVKLYGHFSVVGRAIVVHKAVDDLGRGGFPDSKTTGHAGPRVGCCVIGLALGVSAVEDQATKSMDSQLQLL